MIEPSWWVPLMTIVLASVLVGFAWRWGYGLVQWIPDISIHDKDITCHYLLQGREVVSLPWDVQCILTLQNASNVVDEVVERSPLVILVLIYGYAEAPIQRVYRKGRNKKGHLQQMVELNQHIYAVYRYSWTGSTTLGRLNPETETVDMIDLPVARKKFFLSDRNSYGDEGYLNPHSPCLCPEGFTCMRDPERGLVLFRSNGEIGHSMWTSGLRMFSAASTLMITVASSKDLRGISHLYWWRYPKYPYEDREVHMDMYRLHAGETIIHGKVLCLASHPTDDVHYLVVQKQHNNMLHLYCANHLCGEDLQRVPLPDGVLLEGTDHLLCTRHNTAIFHDGKNNRFMEMTLPPLSTHIDENEEHATFYSAAGKRWPEAGPEAEQVAASYLASRKTFDTTLGKFIRRK